MPYPNPHLLGRIAPFAASLDAAEGNLTPTDSVQERRLSDLRGLVTDPEALEAAVAADNQVVYRVAGVGVPEARGEVPFSVTSIEPGHVAGEAYMTKGHIHEEPEGELYLGLAGDGLLLLFDGQQPVWLRLGPGKVGYIPPGWAHRTVNVSQDPFRFLAVYPGAAGHDYGTVLEEGMGAHVFRHFPGFEVIDDKGCEIPEGSGT